MCINRDQYDNLIKLIHNLDKSLGNIQTQQQNTNKHLDKINGRVADVEGVTKDVINDIEIFKRYRAGRVVDCPQGNGIRSIEKDVAQLKEDAKINNAVRETQKKQRLENRILFGSVIIPLLAFIIAFISFWRGEIRRDEKIDQRYYRHYEDSSKQQNTAEFYTV